MTNNYYITGASFVNKGAEAMLFCSACEVKRRNKNNKITMLLLENQKAKKDNYLFNITECINFYESLYILGGKYKLFAFFLSKIKHKKINKSKIRKLENNSIVLDVSGYAYSSQWGFSTSLRYIFRLLALQKMNMKIILLPQSFGPLEFKGVEKIILDYYAKKAFTNCKHIFARERDGYCILKDRYNLNNISLSTDLVLQTKKIDYNMIVKKMPLKKNIYIKDNSIAIIPNIRVMERSNKKVLELYSHIINKCLEIEKNVYLISHSTEDLEICKIIKKNYNKKVDLIESELSSFDYVNMISNFDFIIASRYHSIIQALKENVPVIAIGWANKYNELMDYFNQNNYCFDIREKINTNKIINTIEDMNSCIRNNRKIIKERVSEAQKNNCFNILDEINE